MSDWLERLQNLPYLKTLLSRAGLASDEQLIRQSDAFWQRWLELEAEKDVKVANAEALALFNFVRTQDLPMIEGTRVTFIYYGEGDKKVSLVGDWNGWEPEVEQLKRCGRTPLFALERHLPLDGRLGYQLVIDDIWGPDPRNPNRQMVLGEHSIVQMPGFQVDPSLKEGKVPRGAVEKFKDVKATPLEKTRNIYVYLPKGYDDADPQRYPVIYFQDGDENLERGNIPDALDKMIARGAIPPVIAVFVPNGGDRRNDEYTPYFPTSCIDDYRKFFVSTVMPLVEGRFKIQAAKEGRMILGQSFGATISSYIAYHHPELFDCVGCQSGVFFWEGDVKGIAALYAEGDKRPLRFYLDSTMFSSEPEQSQAMVDVLNQKGYAYTYHRRATGHNYESWRFWMPDALRFFLKKKGSSGA